MASQAVNKAQKNFPLNFRGSFSFADKFAIGFLNSFSRLILPASRQKGSHVSQLTISAAIKIKPSAFAGALEARSATFSNPSLCSSLFIKLPGLTGHSVTFPSPANSGLAENDSTN